MTGSMTLSPEEVRGIIEEWVNDNFDHDFKSITFLVDGNTDAEISAKVFFEKKGMFGEEEKKEPKK